ncbi:TPA: hypothetical protein N0F65_011218 [Lagenidium giganteum]|uniref:Neutral ceramidase n=1 Tax=Lagenidium giganteum TaxID=4803 RepID=A0AAV2YQP3_9STRA|nr:TPA: hypothetical protein N0F65_011218 [Lagenidium giganteum]
MGLWRQLLGAVVLMALQLVALGDAAHYIGVGKADITGPAAEVVMMGYGLTKQRTAGLLNRLYARAFIIEDAEADTRVVFVNCDLAAVFQLVHQEVLHQLKSKYGGVYTEQNVVLHGIHTHAGPGGSSAYFLYDASILGFNEDNFEIIVDGILAAIDEAHHSLTPGQVRFNKGEIADGGANRSPVAYEANPAEELTRSRSFEQFDRSKLLDLEPGVVMDTVPLRKHFGSLRRDVDGPYTVGSTVSASFYGGHPKNRLKQIHSFCDVEKEVGGEFTTVLTDAHWDVRFHWARKGISESASDCEWYIRANTSTSVAGRYRIRHRGFHKPLVGEIKAYEGFSSRFEVV